VKRKRASRSSESLAEHHQRTQSASPQGLQASPKGSAIRPSHTPSPLSFPENNSAAPPPRFVESFARPLSPASQSSPALSPPLSNQRSHQTLLRQVKSSANIAEDISAASRPPLLRNSPAVNNDGSLSPTSSSSPSFPPKIGDGILASHLRGNSSPSRFNSQARSSSDVDPTQSGSSRSRETSPMHSSPLTSSISRNTSLRSKMSLPNLRGRTITKRPPDEIMRAASGSQSGEFSRDSGRVQVMDTDFELISPIHPSNSSDDSLGRLRSDPSDGNPDFSNGRFSSDRQIFSRSSAGTSSPTLPDGLYQSSSKSSDSDFSMDAHRQRELRWISIMTSVPAAQSRTNKKVKKLLMDGVPSSVRFLVWTHLTDSKYRGVPGIYSQLVIRGKASILAGVERDIQSCLDDQPRLRGTRGSALSLMQAYLAMVPDIQYQRGEK
jgi:TBC1 domain family member 10